jgi:hypothetical protein
MLLLSACADESNPTDAIESYLKAQVAGNADNLVKLSCAAWEAEAKTAAASFQSVDAKIDDLKCTENGSAGDYKLITCEGIIVIQYRGEDPRSQNVPDLTYRAVKENNEWKMCGTQTP